VQCRILKTFDFAKLNRNITELNRNISIGTFKKFEKLKNKGENQGLLQKQNSYLFKPGKELLTSQTKLIFNQNTLIAPTPPL